MVQRCDKSAIARVRGLAISGTNKEQASGIRTALRLERNKTISTPPKHKKKQITPFTPVRSCGRWLHGCHDRAEGGEEVEAHEEDEGDVRVDAPAPPLLLEEEVQLPRAQHHILLACACSRNPDVRDVLKAGKNVFGSS